jgi:hypothetical protein
MSNEQPLLMSALHPAAAYRPRPHPQCLERTRRSLSNHCLLPIHLFGETIGNSQGYSHRIFAGLQRMSALLVINL